MQTRVAVYLLGLIFSYLVTLKVGMSAFVQPIRLALTLLLFLETFIFLKKVDALKFPSYKSGIFILYIFALVLLYPFNLAFNIGSVVKYICYTSVFLAAYNGFNFSLDRLFNYRILLVIYIVGFWQIFIGDTEFINMVERVSGVYYKHSSGMALFLTLVFGHIAYSSRISWRYIHLIFIAFFILKTGSRSAVLGILLSIIIIEIFIKRNYKFLLFTIGIGSLLYVFLFDFIKSLSVFDRFVYLVQQGTDGSTSARIGYFNRALEGMPVTLFGNGFGSFTVFYEELYGKRLGAHNNLLLFLIETGFVGLSVYILHLFFVFKRILELNNYFLVFAFFSFYIGGGLNNNYYYPAVMIIFFFEFGKRHSNEYVSSS